MLKYDWHNSQINPLDLDLDLSDEEGKASDCAAPYIPEVVNNDVMITP